MTDTTWEKSVDKQSLSQKSAFDRYKFIIGGVLMLGAVVYLMLSGTMAGSRYFITVDELMANPDEYVGQTVRVSGAVIGETIDYDAENLIIDFTVAHIPEDITDLALTLHLAVSDPDSVRMPVHIENEVMPDLLQNEAQAILTGALDENGVFQASELLLKCPSRYEEAAPDQVVSNQ
jgi:cytochrome c-type biogenesis protein CcmE